MRRISLTFEKFGRKLSINEQNSPQLSETSVDDRGLPGPS